MEDKTIDKSEYKGQSKYGGASFKSGQSNSIGNDIEA